jgi:hypothetical protein
MGRGLQALTRMVELKDVNTADFVRLNGLSYLLDSLRTMLADPRVAKAGAALCLAVLSSRSSAVLLVKHSEVRRLGWGQGKSWDDAVHAAADETPAPNLHKKS